MIFLHENVETGTNMANENVRANRPIWKHPVFIAGFAVAALAIAVLPAQYIPVLWRHDREFIALGLTPLVVGAVIASARRPIGAVRTTVIAAALLIVAATIGYRIYDGIGWPDPLDIAVSLAMVAAPVWAMVVFVKRRPQGFVTPFAALLSIGTLVAFGFFAADQQNPSGIAVNCEIRDDIEYCYYAGFGSFVDRWEPAVNGVMNRLPPEVRANAWSVVQTADKPILGPLATPFLDWDRPSNGTAELALALDVANSVLGINDEFKGLRGMEGKLCTPRPDDGRSVIAFWLAGQSTTEAGRTLRSLNKFGDAITGSEYAAPVIGSGADYAVLLLDRPVEEIATLVRQHWIALTNPLLTVNEVRALFDLPLTNLPTNSDEGDARFYTQDCV